MAASKIAVVVGATGKQGTGIVQHLLATGEYHVRAITRDPKSEASRHLASLGAELCTSAPASFEQLSAAFRDAYAVFGQTPHGVSEDFEIEAALAQARAADSAGVKSFVISSLENVDARSQLAYFYTNFLERFRPRKDADGSWVFKLPVPEHVEVPWTDAMSSIGPVVAAIFRDPKQYGGQTIPVINELLSSSTIAQQFAEVTGQKARSEEMTQEQLFAWGLPGSMAQWQWDQYQYTIHLGYYAPERDLNISQKLDPAHVTWKQFLQQTGFDGRQTLAEIRASMRGAA